MNRLTPEREKNIRLHSQSYGSPIEDETVGCDSQGCRTIMEELIAEIDALRIERDRKIPDLVSKIQLMDGYVGMGYMHEVAEFIQDLEKEK